MFPFVVSTRGDILFWSRNSYYLCKTGAASMLGIRDHFAAMNETTLSSIEKM